MTRRAGLFGGTFDPVHLAHLALARQALAELALDEVRWVPAGQPWQKARTISSALHRQSMLQLALAGEPRFVLDPIELARSGASYSIDTVLALRAAEPRTRWTLLLGQDQYAQLHSWHRWRELLAEVDLAVAARPGAALHADAEVARHPVQRLALPPTDISATDIRRRVAAHEDISALVPPEVAGYIARHGLYLNEPARS